MLTALLLCAPCAFVPSSVAQEPEASLACQKVDPISQHKVYDCASSKDVYAALDLVKPGDSIVLQGGVVYELKKSLKFKVHGTEQNKITFTSHDKSGLGRYAVLTTVDGKKEENLVAVSMNASFWNISKIEIAGKRVAINKEYWDVNGFRIGLYFSGIKSKYNTIEDVHIHHTHNAAVAIRNRSHHNTFRRMKIHHIGEWLNAKYDAHEAEGFYIGSSKGREDAEGKAIVNDIVVEDSVIGPGLLGQFIDIKYAASQVVIRDNTFYCGEKASNSEIVKVAGYANLIKNNTFIGENDNLTRYISIEYKPKSTKDSVLVDYLGEKGIPAPSGKDNKISNNVFPKTNRHIIHVQVDKQKKKKKKSE